MNEETKKQIKERFDEFYESLNSGVVLLNKKNAESFVINIINEILEKKIIEIEGLIRECNIISEEADKKIIENNFNEFFTENDANELIRECFIKVEIYGKIKELLKK
jgi:hypothetical protein